MAAFLRGKQAGIQNDLSAGILPGLFAPDDLDRFGINSQIGSLAFDPVQSLLAVGTNETTFGSGQIYIFGQKRVQVKLTLPRRASVKTLQFCADRLISVDSKNEVIVWDLATAKKEKLAPLRLPNFWREMNPRSRLLSCVSLQLHPRDIGQLLIGYTEGAVIYSFKQNKPIKFFQYEVPAGAPGGNGDPTGKGVPRQPRLTQAIWHPTGTFIATAHDDASIVFWDPKDGRIVMARTLQDTHVNVPGSQPQGSSNTFSLKGDFAKIAWCCKGNPDDTGLLIAGGIPTTTSQKGLTFMELGVTPVYATSTWQILTDHFDGKRSNFLPIPVDVVTLSFPSGHPISPTNQLHPSLTFVHPFVNFVAVSAVDRGRWLGMTETRAIGPQLLKGGAEGVKHLRRYEARNIIQTAHGDGTVRIWDAGHGDELENSGMLQIDVARAVAGAEFVSISAVNMASSTGELCVGTAAGEVVVYRWGGNRAYGSEQPANERQPGGITDISIRAEPSLKEGLQPFILYDMAQGPISAIRMSDVGFVGVGSEGGIFSIIDLRGPSVIFTTAMSDFIKQDKRSSFMRKGSSQTTAKPEWPVCIEFGVMTLDDDKYSSIACFVGTNSGKVATFKILPQQNGGYTAQLAGVTSCSDKVISITPIVAETGKPASATGPIVAALRNGQQTHGALVVVTQTEARIFKPSSAKGAHKTFDDVFCDSAAVTEFELHGFALVGVFGDGTARAYSLPALKEIGSSKLDMLDKTRSSNSVVTPSGDIIGWTGPNKLFNPEALIPPRPTISNLQWISGTQHVSPTDLDLLIGGPDRPPSKRMLAASAEEERLARNAGGGAGPSGSQEGWGDYMTRQLNERTENLNIMGDNLDKVQENSAGWADDVSKYVNKQKRSMLLGGITGKWF
ncbi:snare-dependent exocytosis protein [Botrytis cinerea]